jgi:hypothetical protein
MIAFLEQLERGEKEQELHAPEYLLTAPATFSQQQLIFGTRDTEHLLVPRS